MELEFRYWSNASHWESQFADSEGNDRIPEFDDEVIIESGWNMIYDIEDSPKLAKLEIRGKLTF